MNIRSLTIVIALSRRYEQVGHNLLIAIIVYFSLLPGLWFVPVFASELFSEKPVFDLHKPMTLTLNSTGDRLMSISGSNVHMRSESMDRRFYGHGNYLFWRHTYNSPHKLFSTRGTRMNKGARNIEGTLSGFDLLTAQAVMDYGVQEKKIDLSLLAYEIKIMSDSPAGSVFNARFNGSAVLWQKKEGHSVRALIKAGSNNIEYLLNSHGQPWNVAIVATYYGIPVSDTQQLRGGNWVLKQLVNSKTARIKATLGGQGKASHQKQLTSLYRFDYTNAGLKIVIPFKTSFSFADGRKQAKVTLKQLGEVKNVEHQGKIYGAQAMLSLSTNQSTLGFDYRVTCGIKASFNTLETCGLAHSASGSKNALFVYLKADTTKGLTQPTPTEDLTGYTDGIKGLSTNNTSGKENLIVKLLAPIAPHTPSGTYIGKVIIHAEGRF